MQQSPLGRPHRNRPHHSTGKRLRASRQRATFSGERNHFARWDLHEAALRAILASHTMRRQPTQHIQAAQTPNFAAHTQPIGASAATAAAAASGVAGCLCPSAALMAGTQRRADRPRRQQPYLAYSPRKYLIQQMMNCNQIRRPTDGGRQPLVQASGLASSSLARQLIQQIGQPKPTQTTPISAATAASGPTDDAMQVIKSKSKIHQWQWSDPDDRPERLLSDDKLEVCFHPECAESTVAIRGSQPFRRNGNYYYWEVTIYGKVFGTSMMLGLCTEDQALRKSDYCNLIGLDEHGWSLSHKGLIWHNGKLSKYTNDFTTNRTLTVGLLFDTMRGELSYFLNGENLGVAFSGLNNCNKDLYPVVGSTAKRTRMRLTGSYCGYVSLFERTCYTILKSIKNEAELVQTLQANKVPKRLIDHMAQLAEVCRSQTEKTAKSALCVGQ